MQCLRYSYGWLGVVDFFPFTWIIQYFEVFWNTFMCAIPLMGIGIYAFHTYARKSVKSWLYRLGLSLLLFYVELTLVFVISPEKNHFEYLFTTPIVAYYLFVFLISINYKNKCPELMMILRRSSLWNYCVHPLFIIVFNKIHVSVGIKRFMFVTCACVVTGFVYAIIEEWRKKRSAYNSIYSRI